MLSPEELERGEQLLREYSNRPDADPVFLSWIKTVAAPSLEAHRVLLRIRAAAAFISYDENHRRVPVTIPNVSGDLISDILEYAKKLGWRGA